MRASANSSLSTHLIVAFLCIAFVARLALMAGPVGSDDINYFHFAQQLAAGEPFTELHHHGGRFWFLVLVGLPAAWGGSIEAGAVVSVLWLTVRDVVITLFVFRLLGPLPAASAAGILSLNGVSTTYAGLMVPDPLLSALLFASAASLYIAVRDPRHVQLGWIAAAAVTAAMGYSSKDSGILILVPAILWLGLRLRSQPFQLVRVMVVYGGCFAAMLALDLFVYSVLSGDSLYRFHAISQVHNSPENVAESPDLLSFVHDRYWSMASALHWRATSAPVLILGAFLWAGLALSGAPFRFFAFAGAFLAAYQLFGTSSFTRFIPLPVQERYFESVVPFVALAGAALVARLGQTDTPIVQRAVAVGLPFVVAVAAVPGVVVRAGDMTFAALGRNTAVALRAADALYGGEPLFMSPAMRFTVEPFVDRKTFERIQPILEGEELPAGLYMLNPRKDMTADDSAVRAVRSFSTAVVIDEDPRPFARLASEWYPITGRWARAVVYRKAPATE